MIGELLRAVLRKLVAKLVDNADRFPVELLFFIGKYLLQPAKLEKDDQCYDQSCRNSYNSKRCIFHFLSIPALLI